MKVPFAAIWVQVLLAPVGFSSFTRRALLVAIDVFLQ